MVKSCLTCSVQILRIKTYEGILAYFDLFFVLTLGFLVFSV